jgi:hypothetical protein
MRSRPSHGVAQIRVTVGRLRPGMCDTGCGAEPSFGFPHDRLGTAWLCYACAMLHPDNEDMRLGNADRIRRLALEGV